MIDFPDTLTSTLSFFGRLTDELRRETVGPSEYRALIPDPERLAFQKPDGFFVFQNLKPSATDYTIRISGARYQARTLQKSLPGPAPVEVTFPGEDDFYLGIKSVNAVAKTVTFDKVPFVHRLPRNAPVFGEGAFTTTLAEDLEGVDITTAQLTSVAGLAAGQLLRIVRSRALVARPGPYYPFPAGLTLLHVKVVEDAPGEKPLDQALLRLTTLNTLVPVSAVVGGITLKRIALPAPPNPILVLGPQRDLETLSDARGQAVLFFPGHWALTAAQIEVSHAGHVTKVASLALSAGQRGLASVKLLPV